MPQKTVNTPDQHDCYNMVAAIGEQFNCRVEFSVRYYADYVQVISRCYDIAQSDESKVKHQALSKLKYAHKSELHATMYGLAFDLWCQLDGGGATSAQRGAPVGWNGRPEKMRRRA